MPEPQLGVLSVLQRIILSLFFCLCLIPIAAQAERVTITPRNALGFSKPLSSSSLVCYTKSSRTKLVGSVKGLRFNGSQSISQSKRSKLANINQLNRKLRGARGARRQSLLRQVATLRNDLTALSQCQRPNPTPPEGGVGNPLICADFIPDRIINRLDFDYFAIRFFRGTADVNHDGSTNLTDYRLFLASWNSSLGATTCGTVSSSSSIASVTPTPSSTTSSDTSASTAPSTSANASTSGSTSSDSASSTPPAPANQPPTVNAGVDQVVVFGANVSVNGTATDDGLPIGSALSVSWSQVSGLGRASFVNAHSLSTSVSFSGPGSYTLRLTATDGTLSTTDDLRVTISSTTHACSDGNDNDGDGLVDWQYDLGCSGPDDDYEIAGPRDQKGGWSTYDKASDTRVIYVSSSEGNDAWSGLCPHAPISGSCGPKRTIYQSFLMLRAGSADWLLLKRGDVWRNEYFTKYPQYGSVWKGEDMSGGRSNTERVIIASYGPSASRPRLELTQFQNLWSVANVSFHDLEFYSYRKDVNNPEFKGTDQTGLYMLYANRNITVENSHFRYGSMIVQSVDDVNGQARFDNVQIRRNIIENAYSVSSHSQGIYTSTLHPGYLLLEENVFDHNGWNEEFRFVLYAPNSDLNQWKTIADGRLGIEIDRQVYNLAGLNFTAAPSMEHVAGIIQAAINSQIGLANAVEFKWSPAGHVFYLQSTVLASNSYYRVLAYSGATAGTDLHGAQWLNSASQGAPEATVFNRNMYLSHGYGNTTVRGNIDANGASGGVQLRMGGTVTDNLFLRDPLALTFGHPENPGGSTVGGVISRNVVLGSRDISDQPRGIAISLGSHATTSGGLGSSLIQNVIVNDNIVAHNKLGTGNIVGLSLVGTGAHNNVDIHGNTVYDWARPVWPNPQDTRACGLSLSAAAQSTNVTVRSNSFQQPNGGFAACAAAASRSVSLVDNYYFSTSPNSAAVWSTGWFEIGSSVTSASWISQMGEITPHLQSLPYTAPTRDVESYMASRNLTPTYDAFMVEAKRQSRFDWHPEFTAQGVNEYIRQGFEQ